MKNYENFSVKDVEQETHPTSSPGLFNILLLLFLAVRFLFDILKVRERRPGYL